MTSLHPFPSSNSDNSSARKRIDSCRFLPNSLFRNSLNFASAYLQSGSAPETILAMESASQVASSLIFMS